MRCEVSSITLDVPEIKLSARGATKAKLNSERAWKFYAKKLTDAIFQNNANVDIEICTLAPIKRLPRRVSL